MFSAHIEILVQLFNTIVATHRKIEKKNSKILVCLPFISLLRVAANNKQMKN
jgi:hypothetical protein